VRVAQLPAAAAHLGAVADEQTSQPAAAAPARHRIRDPVIPRQQRAAPIEHSRPWRRRYRFRNGLEGRISQLQRKGLRRTRLRSLAGAQTWVGGISLAHNLQRMALLT
jgi:Transposase DDE domain